MIRTKYESVNESTQTGEEEPELETAKNRYVAVVYHHVSYQAGAGVEHSVDVDETPKAIKMVTETEKREVLRVPDYLALSIISTIIFIPFGIVALDYSFKVRRARETGDLNEASYASKWALQFILFAIIFGPMLAIILYMCIVLPQQND